MSRIKDIKLAPSGEMKIKWVERNMPVLRGIGEDFRRTKPFAGLRVALSVHLEAKTAYLCRVMEMGGAEMLFIVKRRGKVRLRHPRHLFSSPRKRFSTNKCRRSFNASRRMVSITSFTNANINNSRAS